jgi:hypothetical protein
MFGGYTKGAFGWSEALVKAVVGYDFGKKLL